MSHTPGPWKWNQKNKCWHSLDGKPVAYESKWPCGLVFLDVSDETLAFSAPDLLAACEKMATALHEIDQRLNDWAVDRPELGPMVDALTEQSVTPWIAMGRAAIAKAKGKA